MTTPDRSKGDRSRDEVLAGEYVLGVLSLKDRREVEERMRHDRQFAAIVSRWEANLSELDHEIDEEIAALLPYSPNQASFNRIEQRVAASERPAVSGGFWGGVWSSAGFWRSLTFASLVVAVGASLLAAGLLPQESGQPLVADLSAANSPLAIQAAYDSASGRLRILPVAANPDEKSLELWLVPSSGAPKSLGVFAPGKAGELVIPDPMRSIIGQGTTFAVSIEPLGGSPTGSATGPIVASGSLKRP